jgi:hypothetical protein
MVDARSLHRTVLGMLPYMDELVLVNPFVNAHGVRPEFSPIKSPAKFKEQTLRNVVVLLLLEPAIAAGRVHLVPDPLDYDVGFREEIKKIVGPIDDHVELGPLDTIEAGLLAHDETMRTVRRLPAKALRDYVRGLAVDAPKQLSEEDLDSVVRLWKRENEEDHLSLLDPPASSKEGGEFRTYKGFSRETGLFVGSLTGSFVYTTSDTQWARLHQTDGVHQYSPDPASISLVNCLSTLTLEVPSEAFTECADSPNVPAIRTYLRESVLALRQGTSTSVNAFNLPNSDAQTSEGAVTLRVQASAPRGGFLRTDVSRLAVTFGRTDDIAPVPLTLLLAPELNS